MKATAIILIVFLFFICTGADCEIGTNPLIFDGATAVFEFSIKTDTTHYSGGSEINLAEILDDIDADIERISLFDMTLEIDQLRDTAPTVTIAGSIFVDGRMLISMSATQLGTFATERSVFDPQLTSIAVNASTVDYLHTILNGGFTPFVVGNARGTGSVEEMEFRARLRLYTQVHTNP